MTYKVEFLLSLMKVTIYKIKKRNQENTNQKCINTQSCAQSHGYIRVSKVIESTFHLRLIKRLTLIS